MGNVIRSAKYLAAARDQACVHCGVKDGTVVAAHLTGLRAREFGKGTGQKPNDLCVADLCHRCHSAYDAYQMSNLANDYLKKIDQSEKFLTDVLRTILRRIEQGVLEIK